MTPMACTRTLPLHSDSSVRPTTRDPAHTLQTQSRCSIVALTPYSSPRLPRPPPYEKQQKLNYSKLTTETAFFTNAEGEKKHITSRVSLHCHLSPLSLPCCRSFPSIGSPFRTRDPSYTCPAAWNHVNAPLPRNKMIHFSITAMSV